MMVNRIQSTHSIDQSKITQFIFVIINMKAWIDRQLSNSQQRPLLRLFLLGLRGQLSHSASKPYGFYPRVISAVMSLGFAKWMIDLYKCELDVRGYNWLVPEYVYRVREESYLYWQVARVAHKLPTTFTYYKWGEGVMFEIDRKGNQTPFHSHPAIENLHTFNSFLHQYNFPATPERHAAIVLYLKNIKNPYNLHNYLRSKSVNMGDWLRAAYYMIYRELGLTNRWRYDEYVSKPAIYYNWEKAKLAFLLQKDRQKLYRWLDRLDLQSKDILKFLVWFY